MDNFFDSQSNIPYIGDMNLKMPKESKEVKGWIKMVEKETSKTPGINWDSLNVWYGNKLAKYLWEQWGNELKETGFKWPTFLKLLKYRTDKVLLWNEGVLTWEGLIKDLIELIEGPFGNEIIKQQKK